MLRNIFMKNNRKLLYNAFNNVAFCPISKRSLNRNINNTKFLRLDENSLQIRILKYFDDYTKFTELIEQKSDSIQISDYQQDNLKTLTDTQMTYLISYIPKLYLKSKDYALCINNIDKESCVRLPRLATTEMFQYLHSFMVAMPQNLTFLTFYTKVIQKLTYLISNFSKIELLQTCFYVGLQKKTRQSQIILRDCLARFNKNYVNQINENDLAILCNSSYKTSLKHEQNNIIHKVVLALNDNLAILNDATIFITFVKSLRHNQYRSEELLATIGHTIFFNNTIANYNLTACTHILALYAETLYYDEKLLELLIDKCIVMLEELNKTNIGSRNVHFSKQIRVKDLARFLWSLSQLGYDLNQTIATNITQILETHIQIGDLDKNVEQFIDSALSMWILGFKPTNYLTSIINKKTIALIHGKRKKRFVARLNLLLTCIQWEDTALFTNLRLPTVTADEAEIHNLRNRPYLKSAFSALSKLTPKFDIPKLELTSPVPYLNIVGLTGFDAANNAAIYIEIVDEVLKVKMVERRPNGLMKLKERMLKTHRIPILMIYKEELEEKSQLEIERYLERKLKRFLQQS